MSSASWTEGDRVATPKDGPGTVLGPEHEPRTGAARRAGLSVAVKLDGAPTPYGSVLYYRPDELTGILA